MSTPGLDRRSELKARSRMAILNGARALIAERGGPSFTVDELAVRADVARRTIFNHFSSMDEVVLATCTEALEVVVDDFLRSVAATPVGAQNRTSMLDELEQAATESDLPAAISTVGRLTGGAAGLSLHSKELADAAFTRMGGRLTEEIVKRHPAADGLDVELLVSALMSGISVIARRWLADTDGDLNANGRAQWQRLLSRLLTSIRSGYIPA